MVWVLKVDTCNTNSILDLLSIRHTVPFLWSDLHLELSMRKDWCGDGVTLLNTYNHRYTYREGNLWLFMFPFAEDLKSSIKWGVNIYSEDKSLYTGTVTINSGNFYWILIFYNNIKYHHWTEEKDNKIIW